MNISERKLGVISWFLIAVVFSIEMVYGVAVCHYMFLGPLVVALLLLVPALTWRVLKRHYAALAAATGLIPWIVWENHIQCVSDEGPFVGGLGPIYLFICGLLTSIVAGAVFSLIDRRCRKAE